MTKEGLLKLTHKGTEIVVLTQRGGQGSFAFGESVCKQRLQPLFLRCVVVFTRDIEMQGTLN